MELYQDMQRTLEEVMGAMADYAELLGETGGAARAERGFAPGLNMATEQRQLQTQISKLREGIFSVLFTGTFNAGKSTMLNALMRRSVLGTSIAAETAVVSKIIFGAEERVVVVKKALDELGQPIQQAYTIPEFFKAYRVNQDNPAAFVDVDHVLIYLDQDGISGSMVQFVDSPGTNNSAQDTEAARGFAKTASAIVYLVNSTQAFQEEEKGYVKEHFQDNHMKNLFFVFNRFDCLNEGEQEQLRQTAREQLGRVFTDEQGRFDEQLFSERVFYTNAYGSECTRTGRPVRVMGMEIRLDDDATGIPQFEEALGRFLTSGDRDKEMLAAYVPQMAGMYRSAEGVVAQTKADYAKGKEAVEREYAALNDSVAKYERITKDINETCRITVQNVLQGARNEYDSFATCVANGWDDHFAEKIRSKEIKFGLGEAAKLVAGAAAMKLSKKEKKAEHLEKMNQMMAPFTEAVVNYVQHDRMQTMLDNVQYIIETSFDELEKRLNLYQRQLDELGQMADIDIRKYLIRLQDPTVDVDTKRDVNLFQALLGIVGMDPELMLTAGSGKMTNVQALVAFLKKNVFEFVAWYVVAWPIGVAMLLKRAFDIAMGMKMAGSETAGQILSGMKDMVLASIMNGKAQYMMEIEKKLGGAVLRSGNIIGDAINGLLADRQRQLGETLQTLSDTETSSTEDEARMDAVLGAMMKDLSRMCELTNVNCEELLNRE